MLTIRFQPFKNLGSRILNKITDFLTRHSQNAGYRYLDPGGPYEHWASAIKFRGVQSVQGAIDQISSDQAGDTFLASILLGAGDNAGSLTYPIDTDQANIALGDALDALKSQYGARVGLKDDTYVFQRGIVMDSYVEIMGESRDGTIFDGSVSGEFTISGELALSGGGYFYVLDGVFTDITFTGEDAILTVGGNGNARFENCRFECYESPSILLHANSTSLFKNCEFVWMTSGETSDGLIETRMSSSDTVPGIYATFADCQFTSKYDEAVTFFKYEGYDNLGPATEDAWAHTMEQCSKIRFTRCDFVQLSSNPAIPLLSVCRHPDFGPLIDIVSWPILRMILEISWCRFHSNAAQSLVTDATMVNLFHNSFQKDASFWDGSNGVNDDHIYFRSGYEKVKIAWTKGDF